jgi:hypothetical protein
MGKPAGGGSRWQAAGGSHAPGGAESREWWGSSAQHQQALLSQAAWRWKRRVRQVFDRGYGTGPWLKHCWRASIRFVVRWKTGNKLLDAAGQERKAWEIARGKRRWGEAKLLWDTHFRVYRSTGVLALPVEHPEYWGQRLGSWSCGKARVVNRGIC